VAVESSSRSGQQQRSGVAVAGGLVDGAGDAGWQRDERELGSLAENGDGTVPAFEGEVFDVDRACLAYPQAQ
jgi:hypothetical protein